MKFLISCALLLFATSAHAIKFSNQFVEFELPPKWQCALEGAEWVCQSTDEGKKRDAIVVLAAKLKGDLDSLDRYQAYLQGARTFTAPNNQSIKSAPKYAKITQINQHPWVDSLHMESEIPGFYTRYLATLKQDIAILVTYSINKNKYQEYLSQFDEMVKSMKAFRKAGTGINQMAGGGSLFNTNSQAISTNSIFQPDTTTTQAEPKKPAKAQGNGDLILILIVVGAVIGFIIYKKRQGGGGAMPS